MKRLVAILALAIVGLTACKPAAPKGPAQVDQARIENADRSPGDWLTTGRTYSEQHFSPLTKIDAANVGKLGLAWSYETREQRAGEATPIVVDGVMYVTSAWSIVYALDARTGKELWVYDPRVDRSAGTLACCDVDNRGVAVWNGRVYVGAIDGRLIAINAKDGALVWQTQTTDKSKSYTITGAPRVAKGLVFIGNGGAEYGVRGYVSAYDADTGKMKWRFYLVPGDPSKGPDHAASDPQMAMAAKTWNGQYWALGGGGTAWDSIVYDPELDQLYIGAGNGSPWDRKVRSPGGGDNLFLSSIVAVKPETGQYLWHFQETPGEAWDFTATQPIMLATLKIGGADRKVIMHAPKNGFFYVVDRQTGKFISGKNIVPMAKTADTPKGMPISWAYGLDANGRPLENPEARYIDAGVRLAPTGRGAHNWQPMSFSPQTGLVYLPVQQTFGDYSRVAKLEVKDGFTNTGVTLVPHGDTVPPPELAGFTRGWLAAWDPVAQKEVWRIPVPGWRNGGTLATAGGLVFWGQGDGKFEAFDAHSGQRLWSTDAGAAIAAGPMAYELDGEQYIAVMGGGPPVGPKPVLGYIPQSRVTVYKLGGVAKLPPAPPPVATVEPPAVTASAAQIAHGADIFAESCGRCHGLNAAYTGIFPDLRQSPVIQDQAAFRAVLAGSRKTMGMPDFSPWLKPDDADAIRAFVVTQARKLYDQEQAAGHKAQAR
jgi:quinohemoprotein ethanol dehydrogenase